MEVQAAGSPYLKLATKAGRVVKDVSLSIGTGIVAETVAKNLLKSGKIPAAAVGLIAGIGFKTTAEAALTAGENLILDKPLTENMQERVLDAARTGAIDSAIGIVAGDVHGKMAQKLKGYTLPVKMAATGAILGAGSSTAHSATDPKTWKHGGVKGAVQVGKAAALGTALGGLGGAVAGKIMQRQITKQWLAQLEASTDDAAQLLHRGGLKKLNPGDRIQGSDIVGGIQPSILIEKDTPALQKLLQQAKSIGARTDLSQVQKAEAIQDLVQGAIRYPKAAADRALFEQLNRQYKGSAIPIGKYVELGIADCRTFASTTQLLLQEAGINSYYTYGRMALLGQYRFDHAFNVMMDGGKPIVVDSLFRKYFNLTPLEDMFNGGKWLQRFEPHDILPYIYRNPADNVPAAVLTH